MPLAAPIDPADDGGGGPLAHDQATIDFYTNEAAVYAARHEEGISRWLAAFMAALPAGARILELGCGGGREAETMIAHGFDVDPTDGTPGLAAEAERRLGRPVRILRFDRLDEVEAYDAVWANASLLHVPRDALPDVLARVFRALRPGGLHFANYKAGGVAGRDGFGRYYNYPDRAALIGAYERSASWDALSVTDYVGSGYEGGETPWLAITVRRPAI